MAYRKPAPIFRLGRSRRMHLERPNVTRPFQMSRPPRRLGCPSFARHLGFALFAPKGTLQAVRDQLSDSIDKALDAPSVRKRLLGIGGDIPPKAARGPQSLTALVQKKLPGGDRSSRRRTLRASAHPHPHKSRSTKRRRWHFEAERLRSLEVDPRSSASSETLKNFFSAVS